MSKRNKKINLDKDVLEEVEVLRKENNNLKKRISKLRKLANKNNELDGFDAVLEDGIEDLIKKEAKCDTCGGILKRVAVLDTLFNVCQKCKKRIRIS